MSEIVLKTENLGISFGAHKAVQNVSLEIEKGKLTTILGPNGAGKTTFFNLISGLLTPTTGKIFFEGTDITSLSPTKRVEIGVGRSFQLTNVFPRLTAYENIRLAAQSHYKVGFKLLTNFSKFKDVNLRTEEILERVLLTSKKNYLAADLPHGEQRKLELGMALALDPKVLLLDEPTAGMAIEEVPTMIDIIEKTHELGTTIVLIEHKMDMVKQLSDRLVILANGSVLADGEPEEVSKNEEVLAAYLGGGVLNEVSS